MAKKPTKTGAPGKARKTRAAKPKAAKAKSPRAKTKAKTAKATKPKKPAAKRGATKKPAKRAGRATKPAATSAAPLPATRSLTARATGRTRTAAPKARGARKLNLRPTPRLVAGRGARPSSPQGAWPVLEESPSETALRDRILVCLLALEAEIAGRDPGPGLADPATVAACAGQIRDWLRQPARLHDGRTLSRLMFEAILADELAMLRDTLGETAFDSRPFAQARARLVRESVASAPKQ